MKNGVMIQYFGWNLPNTGRLWQELKEDAAHLHEIGITSVWIPPAYKAHEQQDEGWGIWVTRELHLDGMRLDVIKHMKDKSIKQLLEVVRAACGEEFYAVGEYWKNEEQTLGQYLDKGGYEADFQREGQRENYAGWNKA